MTNDAKREPSDGTLTENEPADATPGQTPDAGGSDEPDAASQRDEYHDLLLRKTAEFDNYRKRIDRERVERTRAAAADLLEELLPLVDDLERALRVKADDTTAAAYREGVELIHRQLLELLRKRGVTPIETTGRDFDPHVHQAVAHELSAEHREGEVIDEFRRGYMLGERLLRAAMVRVAKA